MADREHPKTPVEKDDNADLPRKQPESPRHEGIDPLTESDTMYPREDVKGDSEKTEKAAEKEAAENLDEGRQATEDTDTSEQTVKDQQEVNAKADTPDALLPDDDKPTGQASDTAGSDSDAKPAAEDKPKPSKPAKPASN